MEQLTEKERSATAKVFGSSSDRKTLARILPLAAAALAVLFFLDSIFFRPLYLPYLEPSSYAGVFEWTVREVRDKKYDQPRHVLVPGDSQIGEDFSVRIADE